MHQKQFSQVVLFSILTVFVLSAATVSPAADKQRQQQQQSGITWAQQAMLALTGGNPVSSVMESGTVTRTVGGEQQQGSLTLLSTGIMTNQMTISVGAGNLSEIRSWSGYTPTGQWTGLDGQQHQMAQQNCWTDAVWFFPALSLLADFSDPNLVFTDLGQVQYSGGTAEHIQVYRSPTYLPGGAQQQIQALSTVDYYLDSQTALPVAMAFSMHGDQNATATIPVALVFSQYQSFNGVLAPLQVTRMLNGSPFLQINITSVTTTGLNSPAHK